MNLLLEPDHAELDELLAQFFSAQAAGNLAQSLARLDLFWARLAMHIRAEHLHLFPTLLHALETREQRKKGDRPPSLKVARCIIAQLRDDHDFFMSELVAALKQLRELRQNSQANAVLSLGKVRARIEAVGVRLRAHNELEETKVYQWSDALLDPSERAVLNEKMKKEIINLPSRFRTS